MISPKRRLLPEDTAAPKGYRPFYISHYGRHGSRYHFLPYFFGTLEANLHHADSLDNLTPDGSLLLRQVDSILVEHDEMLGNLTARGQREHKLIAERMSDRFPAVFNDKERNLVDAYIAVRIASSALALARSARSSSIIFANSKVIAASVTTPPLTVRKPPDAEPYFTLSPAVNLTRPTPNVAKRSV